MEIECAAIHTVKLRKTSRLCRMPTAHTFKSISIFSVGPVRLDLGPSTVHRPFYQYRRHLNRRHDGYDSRVSVSILIQRLRPIESRVCFVTVVVVLVSVRVNSVADVLGKSLPLPPFDSKLNVGLAYPGLESASPFAFSPFSFRPFAHFAPLLRKSNLHAYVHTLHIHTL